MLGFSLYQLLRTHRKIIPSPVGIFPFNEANSGSKNTIKSALVLKTPIVSEDTDLIYFDECEISMNSVSHVCCKGVLENSLTY